MTYTCALANWLLGSAIMGSFATSYHVKSNDAKRIADAASKLLRGSGYRRAEQRPDQEFTWADGSNRRALWIADSHDGWVGIFDTGLGEDSELAAQLARELNTQAIHVMVNDSDSWLYALYQSGALLDEFDSMPDGDFADFGDGDENAADQGDGCDPDALMLNHRNAVQDINARLDQLLPPEISHIKLRMQTNAASAEEVQRFMLWMQQNSGQLVQDLMRGGGMPMTATLPARHADTPKLREHVRKLKPFLHAGVSEEMALNVMGEQAIFAEEILAKFLPLVGISAAYARLNYGYLQEEDAAELQAEGIALATLLKFER